MATSLPGFRGVPSQDAQILAMKAGPVDPGHSASRDGHRLGHLGMPVYDNPVPPAEGLQPFAAGAARDRTPRTHAAPRAAWAQMDAGTAQAVSNDYHRVRFADPHTSQYVPASQVPTDMAFDVGPGENHLAKDVPAQLRFNGRGSGDISQGGGVGNGYGFDSHHTARWRSRGWVPTWFVGSSERPVRVDPMQGRNRSYDVDSTVGAGGQVQPMAATYTGAPTAYQAPGNPTTRTGYTSAAGYAW